MKCPKCGKEMQVIDPKKPYVYTASGLDNVFLRGIDVYECACGNGIVAIPQLGDLHRLIAIFLLKKPAPLNGKEIKFLRKHSRLKAIELAEKLGVTKTTISRWENDKDPIGKPNDRLFRIFCIWNLINELKEAHFFAEQGMKRLNERGQSEIGNIYQPPTKKHIRFSINIDEKHLRGQLDPFQLEPA